MARHKVGKKQHLIKILEKALGNITIACRNFGIERQTFYNWYDKDEEFRKAVDDIKEIRKDFIESALDRRIQAGDTAAIIFAAKTQCRDRGYIEHLETKQVVEASIVELDAKKQAIQEMIKKLKDE